MQVINIQYNECYGEFFFPALELLLGSLSVNLMYSSMKALSIGSYILFAFTFIGGFGIIVCQILLYPIAAKVHESSFQLIKNIYPSYSTSVVNKSKRHLFVSRQLSLFPLKVKVGGFYVMRKLTPLTFFSIVMNYSISLLLGLSLAKKSLK